MSVLLGIALMTVASAPVEKQVSFLGAGGFKLYGTLTMPSSNSGHSVPGVILLPGSGPTDRNGNQLPQLVTDLLKDISNSLASSGIATLRFDKRAASIYASSFPKDSTQWPEFFKWENFVEDATAAYRFLGSQVGVDPKRMAIIGHSEGAEIAFQIGSNLKTDANRPVALVSMGGAGRPMGPILVEQIDRALTRQQAPAPVKKQYMDALNRVLDQVSKEGTYPSDIPPGFASLFNASTTKIMHSYCTIDPATLAKNFPGDVLLVNGSHDTQISPERDTPLLKAALQSRKKGSVEMLIVPDASHNLKSTKSGNDDAFTGPVDSLALAKIGQFLKTKLQP